MEPDGLAPEVRRRVELTVSCRDCADLPKVPDAGAVRDGWQTMHNGVQVVAGGYHGAWMQEIIRRLRGHHEPQEERAFHAILERLAAERPAAPVIVELGAFWAYYALWFLARLPTGHAILVEPDPANLAVGLQNFTRNGRVGVFIQAAVGAAAADPAPFVCESDGVARMLPTVSVPSLMAGGAVERIDVLLADVQGAELAVLEGARALLRAGRVRFVVISTHHGSIAPDGCDTHGRCLELVTACGGHVITAHTVAESFSGDGLLVASFAPEDRDLRVEVSRAPADAALFPDP